MELLKQGLAWSYEHYLPEAPPDVQQSYRAAETAARDYHLGLWVDANPQPPWEHRRMEDWAASRSLLDSLGVQVTSESAAHRAPRTGFHY